MHIPLKSAWKDDYSWLQPVQSHEGDVVRMLRNICIKHKTNNKFAVGSEVPCVLQWRDSLRHNCLIQEHKDEVELEKLAEERWWTGGICQTIEPQTTLNQLVILTAMECL